MSDDEFDRKRYAMFLAGGEVALVSLQLRRWRLSCLAERIPAERLPVSEGGWLQKHQRSLTARELLNEGGTFGYPTFSALTW